MQGVTRSMACKIVTRKGGRKVHGKTECESDRLGNADRVRADGAALHTAPEAEVRLI